MRLLDQEVVLENLVLTGLRGVGKTVLLETFKPIAQSAGWLWVGTDLSESSTITETALAIRLITDLSVVSSSFAHHVVRERILFNPEVTESIKLDYEALCQHFNETPGLVSDKLKSVLDLVWQSVPSHRTPKGIIFAYDEAQNLADHATKEQYPLSLTWRFSNPFRREMFASCSC